ncbi:MULTISPECIES: hypothetical protein [Micromonospora]|uniref:Secreted protein n=1 Tax=Micromonospora chalcea TaxID=1874 RepID=A0ABX9Y676_MICCH|nr:MULTISPECIES: hypothetical protein [Micromonospora]ODB77506.1 hypothetical protein A8711_28220 [Micromonospora sp. II]ODB79501.1 hypothetical protein A8711_25275 [Micromonospora sp. II]RQW92322.1 hypothetical protein DLJ60_14790 [Micromonospora chalcea]RQX47714.1 hypothetical protein DLJ57_12395 [Micromonospora chalcea]
MQWVTAVLSFLGGLISATIAAYVVMRTNNQRMVAEVRARWDGALFERSAAFVASARTLRHLAEHPSRSESEDGHRKALDEAHQGMRVACEQLRLLGNLRVQSAARLVTRHAYAVRARAEQCLDPRAAEYPSMSPTARLNDALQEFYRAVRAQLGAEDPETVLHDDDLDASRATQNELR